MIFRFILAAAAATLSCGGPQTALAAASERHTQTHLRVERIDATRNLIYIRGSVAGPKNGIVLVKKQG